MDQHQPTGLRAAGRRVGYLLNAIRGGDGGASLAGVGSMGGTFVGLLIVGVLNNLTELGRR